MITDREIERKKENIFIYFIVGLILDQTRSCTSQSDLRSDIVADLIDSTREESSLFTTGLLFKSCRCLYVGLHDIRVHGIDGILSGEHRSR